MGTTFLDNLLRALSWTFIHSLWQGLILTILAGMVMIATKKFNSSLRYVLLCSLFFLFLAAVGVTFLIEWSSGTTGSPGLMLITDQADFNALFQGSVFRRIFEQVEFFLNSNAQWIVFIWLIVLVVKAAKMIVDIFYVHRLRTHHLFTPGNEWVIRLQTLSKEIGIRKEVTLIESALVKIPIVAGHFKPMILVPVGILTNLPAAEVEAVLLHELAHIRRHDYLVNFIQRIAELLFFFNPALLWVSSLLRVERENCCDDMAIAKTKNKLQFVEALIRFKEYSMKHQGYALGLFGKRNPLLQRMSRLVYNKNKSLSWVEAAFFLLSGIILLLLVPGPHVPEANGTIIANVHVIDESKSSFALEPDQDTTRPSAVGAATHIVRLPLRKNNSAEVADKGIQRTDNNQENPNTPIEYVENGKLKAETDPEQAGLGTLQQEQYFDQGASEKKQIEANRIAVERDRNEAEKDRVRAQLDRERAIKDREQAQKDRERAELDRQKADRDRKQAESDRKQAQIARQEAEKLRH